MSLRVLSRLNPWVAQSKRRLLAAGDSARDGRNWSAAAGFYREYLDLQPEDFGIWVQAGHALKESGRMEEARAAYAAAQQINGEDADLFLQIGHLLKLMNRRTEAVAAYQSCLRLGGSIDAQIELSRLGVVASARPSAPSAAQKVDEPSRTADEPSMPPPPAGPQPTVAFVALRPLGDLERETLRQGAGCHGATLAIHEPADGERFWWRGDEAAASLAKLDAIIRHSDAEFVAIAMTGALPRQGWSYAFHDTFVGQPLAFAAVGLVVNEDGVVIFGGSRFAAQAGVIPTDTGKPAASYTVRSSEQLDVLQPGFIAIAADLYRELGGFALRFATVEEELLDLGARARAAGYHIVRSPRAVQVLTPGAASDLELRLPDTRACGSPPGLAKRRPRVLVIDHRTPSPDQDSGSVDTFWTMRTLKSLGYEVTFVPYYETRHAGRYTTQLEALGVRCPVDDELGSVEAFLRQHGSEFDAIFIYRVVVAFRVVDLCREVAPQAKVIFFTVDLHFLREERIAAQTGLPEDIAQAAGTKVEELRCIRTADATVVVSGVENDLVGELVPQARRYLIPVMHPAPGRLGPRAGRDGVLFVGGFGHAPNHGAVTFLCEEVWPRVRRTAPELKLYIAGSNPPDDIRAYGSADTSIEVLGFVEDLYPYYRQCAVNVAPLRYGAGVKGKVVAALMVGLPTIASPAAVEGMNLTDGDDVIVGRDADEIAAGIVRLVRDAALWQRVSDSGLRVAHRNFSVDAQVPRLRRLLRELDLPC